MGKKKLVVFTGAGISAESGISTFRDADGLWEGHDVMEVASPFGWQRNPELVLDFYNQRRRNVLNATPNAAHHKLVELEDLYDVQIITQNVDDLHERAGSSNVLHLHGELTKVRSIDHPNYIKDWNKDLNLGDCCPRGSQLRPHIVWFGESVPMMENAMLTTLQADIFLVIGSSLVVYPAASLVDIVSPDVPVYIIDPGSPEYRMKENVQFIQEKATVGMETLASALLVEV